MFNVDPFIHGVLVQIPLPQHIYEEKILNVVSIEKDVDGFHPMNIGWLAMLGENLYFPLYTERVHRVANSIWYRYDEKNVCSDRP